MSQRWSPPTFRRLGSQRSSLLRDFSPESDDMFFSDLPSSSWNFPSRNSNIGSRFGDSVFNSFPRRSTMRPFSSHFDSASSHDPFESGWHQPSWMKDELRRSRGSSPSDSMHTPTPPGNNSRSGSASPGINHQSFFSRQDSIPIRVVHETSRQNSRASTPASGTSDCSHLKNQFEMQEETNSVSSPEPGLEKHPGISAKTNAKQPHTAKRQPKVHHIPIYVEPRDNNNPPTPPTYAFNSTSIPMDAPRENVEKTSHEQVRSGSKIPSHPSPRTQRIPEPQASQSANPSKEPQPDVERIIPVKIETKPTTEPSVPPKKEKKTEIHVDVNPPAPAAPAVAKVQFTPTETIKLTLEAAEELRPKIDSFNGQRGDKEYLYLDEMLTRNLIKLDLIETDGNPELRQNRRAAILKINELIHSLENKVKSHEEPPEAQASEEVPIEGDSTAEMESKSTEKPESMSVTEDESTKPVNLLTEDSKSAEQKDDAEMLQGDAIKQDEQQGETKPMEAESSEIENSINLTEAPVPSESNLPVAGGNEPNHDNELKPPPAETVSNVISEPLQEITPKDNSCAPESNSVVDMATEGQPTTESESVSSSVVVPNEPEVPSEVEPKKFKSIMNVQVTDSSDLTLPPHGTVDVAAT